MFSLLQPLCHLPVIVPPKLVLPKRPTFARATLDVVFQLEAVLARREPLTLDYFDVFERWQPKQSVECSVGYFYMQTGCSSRNDLIFYHLPGVVRQMNLVTIGHVVTSLLCIPCQTGNNDQG